METLLPPGPALAAVLRTTTLGSLRSTGDHDVIVVGGGAAGGLAALLLAEAGLRVLVLEAGRPPTPSGAPLRRSVGNLVRWLSSPDGLKLLPPALIPKTRAALKLLGRWRQPVQSRCYAWELAPEAFVDDRELPYLTSPGRPFVWIRARLLGGRVAVPGHGHQYYRLGPCDFSPSDGMSSPWPLHPGELDPWYCLVERRLGLAGRYDGLSWLPDSELSKVIEPTLAETELQEKIRARWPGSRPVLSRYASPLNSLEAAALTGRLQCRQGAIVREVLVDDRTVRGVTWIDQQSGTEQRAHAALVFLCASSLESTRILMLSRSERCPNGLTANSGVLGHYLMDHVVLSAYGVGAELPPGATLEDGRCVYLSRFDARNLDSPPPGRGFGIQIYQYAGLGGRSHFLAVSFAEMLPRADNRVVIDYSRRDAWGVPVLKIDCAHGEAELAQARDQAAALRELADVASVKILSINDSPAPPGSAVHECGTARMGDDPESSIVDRHNECWEAQGLYVTDAACFPSQGNQNPTLTILALTARACDHALRSRYGGTIGVDASITG